MAGTSTRTTAHVRSSRHTARRSAAHTKRHLRVRKKIAGGPLRPRLAVTRSARNIFAQLIDDEAGRTLASASTLELREAAGDKKAKAQLVGKLLAERARSAGVTTAVFDRGGRAYHGRVAALADGARESGLRL